MFCGLLNFYCVIEEVLSELVAQAAGALLQDISIFHFCLLAVVVGFWKNVSTAFHYPPLFCFPRPLHFIGNSSSSRTPRAGLGSLLYLPFLWLRPSALPLPDHLGLLEVSTFWAHTGAVSVFGLQNSLKTSSRIKFLHLRTGSQSADWDKVLFAESFSSPMPPLHLLSEWFNVTPSVRLYLSRWTALLKVNVTHEVL